GQRLLQRVQGAGAAGAGGQQQLGAPYIDHHHALARPDRQRADQLQVPVAGRRAHAGQAAREPRQGQDQPDHQQQRNQRAADRAGGGAGEGERGGGRGYSARGSGGGRGDEGGRPVAGGGRCLASGIRHWSV